MSSSVLMSMASSYVVTTLTSYRIEALAQRSHDAWHTHTYTHANVCRMNLTVWLDLDLLTFVFLTCKTCE